MRKKAVCFFAILGMIVFCGGCNGTITRDIRHSGFSISGSQFVCDDVFSKEIVYQEIFYLDSSFLITKNGNVYEVSLEQKYSNKQNCKKVEVPTNFIAVLDNKIAKGSDNKLYYLTASSNLEKYSEVTPADNSYEIYSLLFSDDGVIKVITVNQSTGTYFFLKNDGNVYKSVISRDNYQSPYRLISTSVVYDSAEYGNIIDFNYSGNLVSNYIITDQTIYRMRKKNSKECSKYVDIECEYESFNDETLYNYRDKILGFNGNLLITTYGKKFTVVG